MDRQKAVAIAAGGEHSLVLTSDGTVLAWGSNSLKQCDVPKGLEGVTAVAAGLNFSAVLKTDGTVAAWGEHFSIPRVLKAETDGQVWKKYRATFRGDSDVAGQIARMREAEREEKLRSPVPFTGVKGIASGFHHLALLLEDGSVKMLGDCPKAPSGLPPTTVVAAGGNYTVALAEGGRLTAWGNYVWKAWHEEFQYYRDGGSPAYFNIFEHCLKPVMPPSELPLESVVAGPGHTAAIARDGRVMVWGSNAAGECRIPSGLKAAKAVAAGCDYTLALKPNGRVVQWGSPLWFGRFSKPEWPGGMKVGEDCYMISRKVEKIGAPKRLLRAAEQLWGYRPPIGLSHVAAIAAGYRHMLALKEDGTVVSWGNNECGQCDVPEVLRINPSSSARRSSYIW